MAWIVPPSHHPVAFPDRSAAPGWRSRSLLPALLSALMSFSSCPTDTLVCETAANCPAEYACIAGECQRRECISSASCSIEQYCDQTLGKCQDGCQEESDCPYGQTCSSGQCAPRPCRSTSLDCAVGQFCDTVTGTCFDAAGPYCQPCQTSNDCGGGNNACRGDYCYVECSADRPCPAGYDCVSRTSSGQIIQYECVASCDYVNAVTAARQ